MRSAHSEVPKSLRVDVMHAAEVQLRVVHGLAIDRDTGCERVDRSLVPKHQVVAIAEPTSPRWPAT